MNKIYREIDAIRKRKRKKSKMKNELKSSRVLESYE
jgi:hypothetical protein